MKALTLFIAILSMFSASCRQVSHDFGPLGCGYFYKFKILDDSMDKEHYDLLMKIASNHTPFRLLRSTKDYAGHTVHLSVIDEGPHVNEVIETQVAIIKKEFGNSVEIECGTFEEFYPKATSPVAAPGSME